MTQRDRTAEYMSGDGTRKVIAEYLRLENPDKLIPISVKDIP